MGLEAMEEIVELHNLIKKLKAEIKEKAAAIEEKDELIAEQNLTIGHQGIKIERLLTVESVQQQKFQFLRAALLDKDRVIAEQEKTIKDQKTRIMAQKMTRKAEGTTIEKNAAGLVDTLYKLSDCTRNRKLAVIAGIVGLEVKDRTRTYENECRMMAELTESILKQKEDVEKMQLIEGFLETDRLEEEEKDRKREETWEKIRKEREEKK